MGATRVFTSIVGYVEAVHNNGALSVVTPKKVTIDEDGTVIMESPTQCIIPRLRNGYDMEVGGEHDEELRERWAAAGDNSVVIVSVINGQTLVCIARMA